MAAGDVTDPRRVRLESNERVDLVDALALSEQTRDFLDSLSKIVLATPLATAAAPVGLILAGGVALPNTPGAGFLRVSPSTEIFVALDSDGRFLVKPLGTALDVSIPAGGSPQQVYAYFQEVNADQARRRAIPVSPPYTEFTFAPFTTFLSSIGIYVRAGGTGSIVPTDTVNGVTTNLCFLGIATNTAGVVTWDPSFATNHVTTVTPTAIRPASSSVGGSSRTIHDVAKAALYEVARTRYEDQGGFSGSAASVVTGAAGSNRRVSGLAGMTALMVGQTLHLSGAASAGNNGYFVIKVFINGTTVDVFDPQGVTGDANNGSIAWSLFAHNLPGLSAPPLATNNYGAYTEPRHSLDTADRSAPTVVTIGDGIASFGTFDATEFADHSALLQCALNLLCSQGGGQLAFKQNVSLSSFPVDVVVPNASPIEMRGLGNVGLSMGSSKIVHGGGPTVLRNLEIFGSGTVILINGIFLAEGCTFDCQAGAGPTALLNNSASLFNATIQFIDCTFSVEGTGGDDASTFGAISLPFGSVGEIQVRIERCAFSSFGDARGVVNVDLNGKLIDVDVTNCTFLYPNNGVSTFFVTPAFLKFSNASFATGVAVSGCSFRGVLDDGSGSPNFAGVQGMNCRFLSIEGCSFDYIALAVFAAGDYVDGWRVEGCAFKDSAFLINATRVGSGTGFAAYPGILVDGCTFTATVDGISAPVVFADASLGACHVVWTNNSHVSYLNATNQETWFGLKVVGFSVRLVLSGNLFRDLQSLVTYTGSPSEGPRIVEVLAGIHALAISGNTVVSCGLVAAGANASMMAFLRLGVANITGLVDSCAISGNVVGDESSSVCLLRLVNLQVMGLAITGNTYSTDWVQLNPIALSISLAAGVESRAIAIEGNIWNVYGGSSPSDLFFFSSGRVANLSIVGNAIVTSVVFTGNTGLSLGSNVINLVFYLNSAGIPGNTATDPVFWTALIGTLTNRIPPLPGSGVDWTNNIGIRQV